MTAPATLTAAQVTYITEALQIALRAMPPATACDFNGNLTDAGDVMRNAIAILATGRAA